MNTRKILFEFAVFPAKVYEANVFSDGGSIGSILPTHQFANSPTHQLGESFVNRISCIGM